MSIHEKLLDIQRKLVVAKNKHNSFGNFDYRSAEDILQALKPLLTENGLVILLDDNICQVGDRYYIKSTATITDGAEVITTQAYAREPDNPKAKMDESQTTGSTSSYARKYALNGLLALDDNADSDKLNNGKDKITTDEKLITKSQIEELKSIGFSNERLSKMVAYYKHKELSELTYKEAEEAINKQKKALHKEKEGAKNE